MPNKKYGFNEMTINNYCIQHLLPPIFDLWPQRTKRLNLDLDMNWDSIKIYDEKIMLDKNTTIFEDMENFKDKLVEGRLDNTDKFAGFVNGCIEKYGEDKTKYYFNTLFYKFFCFI